MNDSRGGHHPGSSQMCFGTCFLRVETRRFMPGGREYVTFVKGNSFTNFRNELSFPLHLLPRVQVELARIREQRIRELD